MDDLIKEFHLSERGFECCLTADAANLAVKQSVRSQLVQRDGDSRGQLYQLKTDFKLYSLEDDKTPLLSGSSYSKAAFNDDDSVYANVRSRRDAEDRTARTTADDISVRIAAYLSSNS